MERSVKEIYKRLVRNECIIMVIIIFCEEASGRMIPANTFGVDMTNAATPYFQVVKDNRIRFGLETFRQHPGLAKSLFHHLFPIEEKLDMTFISGYQDIDSTRVRREKLNLRRFFKINNWSNEVVWQEEMSSYFVFLTVKNVKSSAFFRYTLKMIDGHTSLYICFVHRDCLFYISSDVLDIVANAHTIRRLKDLFPEMYDTFYEDE